MKVKSQPEDFRVEELSEARCDGGAFALYRLTKQSLGTPEAIDAICRAWRLRREAVGIGGLKDRHAITQQFVSIESGPTGRSHRKASRLNISVKRRESLPRGHPRQSFEIVLRDLERSDARRIVANCPA